ncbi:MAG: InlB B-repeat-containing protein, partial [Oscillospiraceae bacterium]|nr:InlB B-repeat-containing protein [Oscillospiraceae bacterium]
TTKNEHVYAYSWVVDEDGVAQFTEVGTAKGYVCACGDIKSHETHNYVKENGYHLCGCGDEQAHVDADYTQKYNANGKLEAVAAGTGVICADCGAVDPEHKTCEDTFCNTTEHKHFCYCGEEIAEPKHTPIIDEVNNKHICEDCKLDLSDDETNGHKYTLVYVTFTDDKTNATLNAEAKEATGDVTGLICACGAVKSHTHNYEYGVNQEHYCACGAKEATATHKYVTVNESGEAVTGTATGTTYQQCSICGALKNHTHTYNYETDCTCTNPLCDATDHDYYVSGTRHICNNCGNVADNADAATHDYKVDTENHKHVCECGAESNVHDFVNHECECGATNHTKSKDSKEVDGVKVHYCTGDLEDGKTACTYVYTEEEDYGHTYDAVTEKCTDCGALDPDHTHLVKIVNSTGTSDTCRCGATVDHAWGLATEDFDANHQCINYEHNIVVDSETDKVTITEGDRCAKTAAHVFTTTDDEGNKVTLDFCECGAMNPTVLVKAGVLNATKDASGNITYATAVNLETLVATVKTEYLVKLTKAYDAVAAYDITNTINTDAIYTDISVAADEKSQATALAAVETFKTVYADKDNNQAASSAKIGFVLEKDEDGIVTVDHSKRGYAAFADGSVNTSEAVYDMVGETVTIQVKNNPGYTFAGWYATQTPSATDEPLSTSAAYDVEIKDGHYTYYAMFKENAKKTVSFGEGIKYFSNITAAADESNWTTGTAGFPETLSFLANEELVIMADEDYFTDKGIAGITDKYGNIVSNNVYVDDNGIVSEPTSANKANAYKMIVAYDNNFNVSVYSTDTGSLGTTGCYVQFQVGGKTVAAKKFDTRDVTSIQPADPEMTGYEFLGWYFMHDEDQKIQKLKTVTEAAGVLVPKFEKIDDLTVTVKNGTIDSDSVQETYTYGDKILVTADLQNAAGKYFSGWYDENGKLLSEKRTDYIIVTKSMTITAQYTRDTELVLEAGVDLSYSRTSTALTLTATRYLTDDMTLVEVGTLYAVGEVTDLTIENTELGRKTMSATDVSGKNGNFNVTLNLSSEAAKTSVISARSYFIYEDADGVNHTVYSEAVYADPVK